LEIAIFICLQQSKLPVLVAEKLAAIRILRISTI